MLPHTHSHTPGPYKTWESVLLVAGCSCRPCRLTAIKPDQPQHRCSSVDRLRVHLLKAGPLGGPDTSNCCVAAAVVNDGDWRHLFSASAQQPSNRPGSSQLGDSSHFQQHPAGQFDAILRIPQRLQGAIDESHKTPHQLLLISSRPFIFFFFLFLFLFLSSSSRIHTRCQHGCPPYPLTRYGVLP